MNYRYKVTPIGGGWFKAQIYRKRGPFWVRQARGMVLGTTSLRAAARAEQRIENIETARLLEQEMVE